MSDHNAPSPLPAEDLKALCALATPMCSPSAPPREAQARAVVSLLREGATVPFIARYRKERTGGLDELQLRAIEVALKSLEALEARRTAILKRLEERVSEGLTLPSQLINALKEARELSLLEELYAPYKSKRLTKADKAREAGLEPLMVRVLKGELRADELTRALRGEGVEAGVLELLAERLACLPSARARCLEVLSVHLRLHAKKKRGVEPEPLYKDYYGLSQPLRYLKPHQLLALRRGEGAGVLSLSFDADDAPLRSWLLRALSPRERPVERHPARELLERARDLAYEQKLLPSVARSLWSEALKGAEERSAQVFTQNLKALLLSPPLLKRRVLGLDPGLRTGCKLAVIDEQGVLLKVSVCFTIGGGRDKTPSQLAQLINEHRVDVIAIGNGTGSREAEQAVVEALKLTSRPVRYAVVDEAGASVYSASEVARLEFPQLDVSERGAVSIARRLQDPLAELIKVDPQSMGVGMYQHDLSERTLKERVAGVVEDAVSGVGADLNTASAQLLSYIAGLGPGLAERVVAHREANGPFKRRRDLLAVKGLGPKTFEQCAGFVRVREGDEPLDNTAVHPEGYPFARAVLKALKQPQPSPSLKALFKEREAELKALAERFEVGEQTLRDRLEALSRPGRDPREDLSPPLTRAAALSLSDLSIGLTLQGSVRNVVDFGAFVDLGVKRDGLIHVSTLRDPNNSSRRVTPHERLQVGQVVEVCVTHIDEARGRISLALTTPETSQGATR